MSHKTVASTVTLRPSFQRKRGKDNRKDRRSQPSGKNCRGCVEAAQTGTCPKFRNDAGLEGHTVIVTGFTWGQRTAKDTDSCLSERMRGRTHTLLTAWKY